MRPGHFWLLKFGKVPGSNSCVEKKFELGTRKYEEYKGLRFGNGDCALVVDVWLHRFQVMSCWCGQNLNSVVKPETIQTLLTGSRKNVPQVMDRING